MKGGEIDAPQDPQGCDRKRARTQDSLLAEAQAMCTIAARSRVLPQGEAGAANYPVTIWRICKETREAPDKSRQEGNYGAGIGSQPWVAADLLGGCPGDVAGGAHIDFYRVGYLEDEHAGVFQAPSDIGNHQVGGRDEGVCGAMDRHFHRHIVLVAMQRKHSGDGHREIALG
jgi:hypothetical protein